MDPALHEFWLEQRRLLLGQVRSIEKLLGIDPVEEQLRREVKVLKRTIREIQGQSPQDR